MRSTPQASMKRTTAWACVGALQRHARGIVEQPQCSRSQVVPHSAGLRGRIADVGRGRQRRQRRPRVLGEPLQARHKILEQKGQVSRRKGSTSTT